jgi:hypothetical protein
MIDAWFKASEKIATTFSCPFTVPGAKLVTAVITAILAAKPDGQSKHSWQLKLQNDSEHGWLFSVMKGDIYKPL